KSPIPGHLVTLRVEKKGRDAERDKGGGAEEETVLHGTENRAKEFGFHMGRKGDSLASERPVVSLCFSDKQFLTFFFKQLQLNRSGRYQDAFPYLSPCGREHNFVRCDDRPIVFTHLLWGQAGEELLSYCGGGDSLVVSFEPEKLVMFPENGRVYHPAPQKAGGVGLVKSALAFELSPCFEYSQGASGPPTHFRWQGKRYTLTNELVQLIRLNSSA
uniref:Chromosome 8 open reading frame 82 n=1 Tax=Chelonoidis abingdonii TaxID=106734 RepID=A0A8C0J7L1_CHEAB